MQSSSAPVRQIDVRVRFRCHDCDVAWTDIAWPESTESSCWVCGAPGTTSPHTEAIRQNDHFELEFQ